MSAFAHSNWFSVGIDAWTLAIDSSVVVAMRGMKVASGDDPKGIEMRRMVSEKIGASLEMQAALMTGKLGTTPMAVTTKVLAAYSAKVRANRRRLAKA